MVSLGKLILEDGRRILISENGTFEYDTNAWVGDGEVSIMDRETGEDITEEMEEKDLVEFIYSNTSWELDYSWEKEPYV